MTLDPRMVFEMLFGDGGTAAERQEREETSGSILDWISHSVKRLQKGLEPSDRARLANYLDNVREIERRIQRIEKYNSTGAARALPAAPIGVPDSYDEHVKLMFDLQTLAFMTNMTRVSAFKMSRDVNQRVYPESGVKTPFHSCSHHAESPARIAEFAKINLYHASLVPYFLQKLQRHAGWRRQPAGPLHGALRQSDRRFECTQSQAPADSAGRQSQRTAQRKHARQAGRRNAVRERRC